jgi:hypothetical protein
MPERLRAYQAPRTCPPGVQGQPEVVQDLLGDPGLQDVKGGQGLRDPGHPGDVRGLRRGVPESRPGPAQLCLGQ